MLSLIDMCDRPPVVAPEGGVHDIGGHRLRFIPTPHVPHNWEAGLWFDETTSTLLAGDLLTHTGQCPALPNPTAWHRRWMPRRFSTPPG